MYTINREILRLLLTHPQCVCYPFKSIAHKQKRRTHRGTHIKTHTRSANNHFVQSFRTARIGIQVTSRGYNLADCLEGDALQDYSADLSLKTQQTKHFCYDIKTMLFVCISYEKNVIIVKLSNA